MCVITYIYFFKPLKNRIIPYKPYLKEIAKELRKNSTLAEVLLWQQLKNRSYGFQFHRQIPMLCYIIDFYCHELLLAIEVDGDSHLYKYDQDAARQENIENYGVKVLRIPDNDVKKNMFSVDMLLRETINQRKTEMRLQ